MSRLRRLLAPPLFLTIPGLVLALFAIFTGTTFTASTPTIAFASRTPPDTWHYGGSDTDTELIAFRSTISYERGLGWSRTTITPPTTTVLRGPPVPSASVPQSTLDSLARDAWTLSSQSLECALAHPTWIEFAKQHLANNESGTFEEGHVDRLRLPATLLSLPFFLAAAYFRFTGILHLVRESRRLTRLQNLRCPTCNYPLANLPTPTCPECGHNITAELERRCATDLGLAKSVLLMSSG